MARERFELDRDWRFRLGKPRRGETSRDWEQVALPHCWNAQDTFQRGLRYYRGPGVYEREFELPAELEEERPGGWWLVVGGFYGRATVELDGRRLGRFEGQYLGFDCPLPGITSGRTHRLRIEATNRCPDWMPPGTSAPDFLLFGGLSGRVRLERRSPCHLDPGRLRLVPHDLLASPELELSFGVTGRIGPELATVRWSLYDPEGASVAEGLAPIGGDGTASADCELEAACLWSPETPRLYELHCGLEIGGAIVDSSATRLGLREARFDADGFELNGERRRLRGFNRHECLPGLGNALPRWMHRQDAHDLKRLGADFVRLSHYPQQPDFLDACDELGLIVYAELASWKSVRAGRWLRAALRQMEAMIRRDRHRPSIVLWGMGNESQHRRAYVALDRLIQRLDPTRPSTYAENHLYRARRARTLGIPGVWGLNYEVEVLDEVRHQCRTGAVVVAEACNEQAVRGEVEEERAQIAAIEAFWEAIDGKPYVAGHTLWAFNDYPTMFRDRFIRRTGKVDAWRLPKLAAHRFRARYAAEPFIELVGAWEEGGGVVEVDCFTNCSVLELRVGGRELTGVEQGVEYQLLRIPFAHAPLEATGRREGTVVEAALRPRGRAHRLAIEQDEASAASDWRGLQLRVLDEAGFPVTSWSGEARLALRGRARSGAFTADGRVVVARGIGRTFVRLDGEGVAVEASADGLEAAAVRLRPL